MARERGTVSIRALADGHHCVLAEGKIHFDQIIVGHDETDELAHRLARRLGERTVRVLAVAHHLT